MFPLSAKFDAEFGDGDGLERTEEDHPAGVRKERIRERRCSPGRSEYAGGQTKRTILSREGSRRPGGKKNFPLTSLGEGQGRNSSIAPDVLHTS